MTSMTKLFGAVAAVALSAGAVLADPGLIIDLGGKFDKSFNEAAYNGAKRWVEETGGSYKETELQSEAQREQSMRRMAESGANPIVVLGFANASTLEKVAPDYPDTKFAIVDMVVDQPNVAIDRLYRTGRQLSGRHDGRHGFEIRNRQLCWRHGHPADPRFRLWLCAGREGGEPRHR